MPRIAPQVWKKIFHGVMSDFEKKLKRAHLAGYEDVEPSRSSILGDVGSAVPRPYPASVPGEPATLPIPESESEARGTGAAQDPILAKRQEPQQRPWQSPAPARLHEQALKNMADPNILYLRNNTHNKVYGYSPLRPDLFSMGPDYIL